MKLNKIIVGIKSGDIMGNTNKTIQAAIDFIAAQGGGIVEILEGEYLMQDSIHLRPNVKIVGQGSTKTILTKGPSTNSKLKITSGYGEKQMSLSSPEGFKVGDGVALYDDRAQGFHTTVATITEQINEDTFRISRPVNMNCMLRRNAMAATVYPVISGYNCENIEIRDIGIDGNMENNQYLDGCRGGGIYLYGSHNAFIKNCTISNYNGDGISYQNSHDVIVEECICKGNGGLGIHPGGGSERTIVRNCKFIENGSDGFYFCWRATNAVVENCDISNNQGSGFSIGHRDIDNKIINNKIMNNKKSGIEFRNEDEIHAAHRTLIEGNTISENGQEDSHYEVKLQGGVKDVLIRNNRIGEIDKKEPTIFIGDQTDNIKVVDNTFLNTLNDDEQMIFES